MEGTSNMIPNWRIKVGPVIAQKLTEMQSQQLHLPIRCPICPYQFGSPQHLLFHMRKHDENAIFQCECDENFYEWGSFISHIEQKHPNLGVCNLCGELLETVWNTPLHLRQHLDAKMHHACDFCMLTFTTEPGRILHMRLSHRSEARAAGMSSF